MKTINPFLLTDGYKVGHHKMYPEGTELVYSNFTPRSGRHASPNIGGVISFGQQMVMKQIKEIFDEGFFKKDRVEELISTSACDSPYIDRELAKKIVKDEVISEIKKEYSTYLGFDYDTTHIEKLWDLGYLPIEVKALPEGTFVPYGVPVLTIVNTNPDFFWLTNFLETLLSNLLWQPMTSATTAYTYKQLLTRFAKETDRDNLEFVDFQGHDFSMRGLTGVDATIASGLGHATSFKGSDSIPVIYGAREYYNENGFVIGSVPASEHSVMSAGGNENEVETFRHLMKQYPKGVLSVVSDTWNLWDVLTKYLPELKDEILARDGKVVIRPDSGDPVDIICGRHYTTDEYNAWDNDILFKDGGIFYEMETEVDAYGSEWWKKGRIWTKEEQKGVIELLWDLFGGTINEQGYKVLDPHIGAIYGDSITPERAKSIMERLKAKGFASTNIVLGIGSYTYQYKTRDTHGFAMKATYVEISGKGVNIFKNPITDSGDKKSAKGLLKVIKDENGKYKLLDQVTWVEERKGELITIFRNGTFFNQVSFTEIRNKINKL